MGKDSVAERVRILGAEEVVRRYFLCSQSNSDDHPDYWAWAAVWGGEELDGGRLATGLWLELILAALEVCPDDDLWGIGDGSFDHIAIRRGAKELIYAEREEESEAPKAVRHHARGPSV